MPIGSKLLLAFCLTAFRAHLRDEAVKTAIIVVTPVNQGDIKEKKKKKKKKKNFFYPPRLQNRFDLILKTKSNLPVLLSKFLNF